MSLYCHQPRDSDLMSKRSRFHIIFHSMCASALGDAACIARGCGTVNDYVMVTSDVQVVEGSCFVWDWIDCGRVTDDHLPTGLKLEFEPMVCKGVTKRRALTQIPTLGKRGQHEHRCKLKLNTNSKSPCESRHFF